MANSRAGPAVGSQPQGVACDRCRGQKLRCVWWSKSQPCHRCARAQAECTVLPPKPKGRRPRQQPGSKASISIVARREQQQQQRQHSRENSIYGEHDTSSGHLSGSTAFSSLLSELTGDGNGSDALGMGAIDPNLTTTDCADEGPDAIHTSALWPWTLGVPPDQRDIPMSMLQLPSDGVVADLLQSPVTHLPRSPHRFPQAQESHDEYGDMGRLENQRTDSVAGNFLASPATSADHDFVSSCPESALPNTSLSSAHFLTPEAGQKSDAHTITQLAELHVAMFQHRIHQQAQQQYYAQYSQSRHGIHTPESEQSNIQSKAALDLSELRVGQLLSLTSRLSSLVCHFGLPGQIQFHTTGNDGDDGTDGSNAHSDMHRVKPGNHTTALTVAAAEHMSDPLQARPVMDPATSLLILSCYMQLEALYTHTVTVLQHAQRVGGRLKDLVVVPRFTVDGVCVEAGEDMQLHFLHQLCKQTLDMIQQRTDIYGGLEEVVSRCSRLGRPNVSPGDLVMGD